MYMSETHYLFLPNQEKYQTARSIYAYLEKQNDI